MSNVTDLHIGERVIFTLDGQPTEGLLGFVGDSGEATVVYDAWGYDATIDVALSEVSLLEQESERE